MIDPNHPDISKQPELIQDNTIVPFKPRVVTPEVTVEQDVVAVLEFWLKKAKEGQIKYVAVAAVDLDGVGHSAWEPHELGPIDITAALGAVSYLNHRFSASAYEGEIDSDEQP